MTGIRTAWLCCAFLLTSLSTDAVQLIADRNFQDGTKVLAPVGGAEEGLLQYKTPYGPIWWMLGQWGSQQTISGTEPIRLDSGSLMWSNSLKYVVMGLEDSGDSDLILAVNAINEYGGVYRKAGESWPALLISQRISNPQGWFKVYAPTIADLHELSVDIELKLRKADHIYVAGYNSSLHAAQFLLYFTIQNLKLSNPDYGNFLWFGMRFYDDRDALPGLTVQHDAGTGKLIYNIGIAPFCDSGMMTGEWKRVTGDLLPYIKLGLQEAWSRGYLTNSFDLADYKIGGMNMGWEVPGLSDVSMQVRNFGLQAYGVNFAKPVEFNEDGETGGWSAVNMTDLPPAGALGGSWILSVPGADPQLIGPAIRLSAGRYQQVTVRMANAGNPAGGSMAQLFWKRIGDTSFSESRSAKVSVGNGGGWSTYTFDLSAKSEWSGEIVQLRLDPIEYGDGHAVGVDYIRPTSVSVEDPSALGLDLSQDAGVLFWDGVPYQQYTLQFSTDLVHGVWSGLSDVQDAICSDSVMRHTLSESNQSDRSFFRLLSAPGP